MMVELILRRMKVEGHMEIHIAKTIREAAMCQCYESRVQGT